ncbi:MAG: transglutaminase domain-containing protein [Nostoc sp. SerVER01]|nr:transglutaminase domain-containing protein [Nostoc sp. SerVER01]
MPESLENHFLQEVRKLKQKKRKRIVRKVAVLLLLLCILSGFVYLFYQGNISWKMGNSAISNTSFLFSIFFVFILICSLIVFVFRKKSSLVRYQSNIESLNFWENLTLKRIKPKYLLGYTLLIIALVYQTNPYLFTNTINSLVNHIVYKPTPPVLNSPWPWKDRATIAPIVANMPSNVEISIQSVAKYIAQKESDPYLRIKAIHDYVVSRVTYDLDVLKTGIRPAQDAKTVFLTHKGVCEGYANLFMALGRAIGADVVYIRGKIRRDLAPVELIPKVVRLLNSDYDWTNHAWNAVKILDNWQLVDTTWDDRDSSEIGFSYSAEYLTLPPQVMSISHFPDQLDWQLLTRREDYNTFENKPLLTPQFFIENLTLISPTEYQTNTQKVGTIKIASSPNYYTKIVAFFTKVQKSESSFWDLPGSVNLLEDNQDTQRKLQDIKKCQSQSNATGETEISCKFAEPGDYEVFVLSVGQKISLLGQLKFHTLLP